MTVGKNSPGPSSKKGARSSALSPDMVRTPEPVTQQLAVAGSSQG